MKRNERLCRAGKLSAADWDKMASRAEFLMSGQQFGCSESVLLAFQETFEDYFPESAVAMSSAFRGGMGGAGCTCGALAAGQMALGAFFGYHGRADGEQNPEAVKKARALFCEMHDRFRETHKAACCRVLTKGMEHSSPERKAQCARLVKAAVLMAGGIIARESAELA
ncbi:MAG: C-GCAxxG-C-C family protein [Candidatus Adiutrix sp.]|nr:C-GCAxxG-C-C family protein [Candidatus Adiutrix sp.]